jgi:O-antigen ligase
MSDLDAPTPLNGDGRSRESERQGRPGTALPDRPVPAPTFVGFGQPDPAVLSRFRSTVVLLLLGALGIVAALAIFYLQYDMAQASHRILKMIVGVAVALIILARPAWALGLLPLAWVYDADIPVSPIPMVNGMKLLLASIFLGWAGNALAKRPAGTTSSPWSLPLLLFLVWYGFAALRSVVMGEGGLRLFLALLPSLWGALCGLILFVPVYNFVQTWKQIRTLALLFCLGSAVGLVGLVAEAAGTGWQRRVGGGVGQVNEAAAYYATATAFALGLLQGGYREAKRRLLLLGSTVALAAGIIIPASRGAYVGFLVGILLTAARTGIIWVMVLLVMVGTFLLFAPEYAKQRVMSTEQAATDGADRGDALNKDSGGRLQFWRASLDVIATNPIVGVGYGHLPGEIGKRTGRARPAHNLFLETAAETGIPGLVLLLWLFVAGLTGASALLRFPGFPRSLGLAYQSAILVFMVSNMFGGRFYSFNMAGMVSLLTALVFRARALLAAGVTEADEADRERLNGSGASVIMADAR